MRKGKGAQDAKFIKYFRVLFGLRFTSLTQAIKANLRPRTEA